MDDGVEPLADRFEDPRMVVAERGADLARREVEDPPPIGGLDPGALGPRDGEGREAARVPDEKALALVVHERESKRPRAGARSGS